eukprot:19131-Heterococcus_DN1.PRE.1
MPAYDEVLNLLLLLIAAAVMCLCRVYTGDWHGGVRHGRGEYALADGSHFEGIFVQDRKHGPGVLRTADGQQLQQEWRDGKLVWELPLHA